MFRQLAFTGKKSEQIRLDQSPNRNRLVLWRALSAILLLLLISALSPTQTTYAATITVAPGEIVIAANGLCSLREAIINANNDAATHTDCVSGAGADTINLATGSTYTISDVDNNTDGGNGLPSVTSVILIGGNTSIIERSTVGGTPDFRLFHIAAAGNLTVRSATLRNGRFGTTIGGAMAYNRGTLTIDSSLVTNNTTASGIGGAIEHSSGVGPVTSINNTVFSNNSASQGGAIRVLSANITITNSWFTGNSATTNGGTIQCCTTGGVILVSNTTFSGNSAGGAGGAMYLQSGSNVTLNNSTISGNVANTNGGGISMIGGVVNFNHSTIAGNITDNDNNASGDGGGIFRSAGTVNLKNSIVADNIDRGNQAPDCFGAMTTQLYNHVENVTGCTFVSSTGDVTGSDPGLSALANHGGLTQTHIPAVSSVVVDTIPDGTNDCGTTITTDQRTATRATDGNADAITACDKGAVELGRLYCGIQAAAEPTPYTFFSGANLLTVHIVDDGTDLDCLRVTDIAFHHPDALPTIQTGKYWIITPLLTNRTTEATADYTVDLTLPFSTADGFDKVCRYTGTGWDCAATSFVANTSITRVGITQLSDWAVGNNVGPTAITLDKLAIKTPSPLLLGVLGMVLLLLVGTGVVITKRRAF